MLLELCEVCLTVDPIKTNKVHCYVPDTPSDNNKIDRLKDQGHPFWTAASGKVGRTSYRSVTTG